MIYVAGIVALFAVVAVGIKKLALDHLTDDITVHDLKDSEVKP